MIPDRSILISIIKRVLDLEPNFDGQSGNVAKAEEIKYDEKRTRDFT